MGAVAPVPPTPERSLKGIEELLGATRLVQRKDIRRPGRFMGLNFSLEDFCGDHSLQLAFCRDRSRWIHVMCARQSGKTWGDDGIMLDNAIAAPGSTNLFLGLKGTGVRASNWFPIWKPMCDAAGVPARWHNEQQMQTTFDNKSRIMLAGTDDLSNIKKYLGNRLDHGVVIIDEAQDQTDQSLIYLLGQLLPPMLTPTSRVILSGVLPDVPAGKFYSLATDRALADAPELQKSKGYSHHEWGRAANVHTPESAEVLRQYMEDFGLTESDPQIQRDWYMRRVWDQNATAYRYDRDRNGYHEEVPEWLEKVDPGKGIIRAAVPHPGITHMSIGADPGGHDRTSVVAWGWGETTPEIQQLFEWVTPRDTKTSLSDIAAAMSLVQDNFPDVVAVGYFWDPGSGSMEIDTFQADYRLPVVRAATKSDMPGQVRRNNDLLMRGLLKVMIGSAVEEDYQKARWDPDARARGQYKWASQWHPDPSEAGRYALQGYWEAYVPPADPVAIEVLERERHELAMRRRAAARTGNVLEEDLDARYGADDEESQWD